MADPADIQRLIGDIARLGTVESVDRAQGTATVRIGHLVTGDIPWLAARAGATRIWSPPAIGEQVLVLCPEADTGAGLIVGALSSDAHPAPAADDSLLVEFDDGARILYDPAAHRLEATVPSGGTAAITADTIRLIGKVQIEGDVELTGKLTASDDVIAAGKSLKMHKHLGVTTGGGVSGLPQ